MSHSLADSAVYYINSQLGALWQNALRRTEQGVVEPSNRVRDDIALREYSIRNSNNELIFSAIFDKPRIDFACSHEAAFYLKIVEGYFTPYQASFEVTPNVAIKDLTIVFRIDYKLKTIVAEVIANKTRSIQSLALDVANATLASNFEDQAFISYLKKYLQFLHSSGQIALFFLPEFNEDGDQVPVSFAPRARFLQNMEYEITVIHGLDLKSINGTLFEDWLKSIIEAEDRDTDPMNERATCLSECRTTWTTLGTRRGIQFWAKFGPPKLKILCKCEGILTFFIEDLVVLYGDNSRSRLKRTFRKWEITTIVDIIEKVEGSTTTIKLDLKTLHVFKPLCIFSDLDMSVSWAAALKTTIFEFFESHYTELLQTISADVFQKRITIASPYQTGPPSRTLHALKETSVAQYDFIHVLSVEKILQHFHTLLNDRAPSLAQWSHGDEFTTSFGPVRLTFTSQDKALFWIHLKNGSLKSSDNHKRCTVTDWLLAFELPIILAEHDKVVTNSPYWFERFQGSSAWKSHGNQPSRCLHHIYLDFSNAKFVYDNSELGDLVFDEDAPGYLFSAVNIISKNYLKELINHGHHILFSFPVWKAGYSPPPFGITSLTCQTYSKYTYTCENIDLSNAVLVVLGMTSFRKHPEGRLPYTSEWVLDGRIGTVCLSRRIFLDGFLLKALAMINGATTVTPNLCLHSGGAVVFNSGAYDGWRLLIATLFSAAKDITSEWSPNPNKSESDLIWCYSDDWENNHTISRGPFRNGSYAVSCTTKNLLSFSTPQEGALNIILKGDIGLVFKGNKGFNARLNSTWSTTLSMKSRPGGGGLSFEISGDNRPQFRTISTDTSIEQLFDLKALQNLIKVDLLSLASQLCQRFGGRWEHGFANAGAGALTVANPMFNKNWDILLQLRFHTPLPEAPDVVTILPPATDYNDAPISNEVQDEDNALGVFEMADTPCVIIAPDVENIGCDSITFPLVGAADLGGAPSTRTRSSSRTTQRSLPYRSDRSDYLYTR